MLKPHVDQVFAFEDAPAMYAASQGGHGRGKKVLAVAAESQRAAPAAPAVDRT